jgi:hypothetical protein
MIQIRGNYMYYRRPCLLSRSELFYSRTKSRHKSEGARTKIMIMIMQFTGYDPENNKQHWVKPQCTLTRGPSPKPWYITKTPKREIIQKGAKASS